MGASNESERTMMRCIITELLEIDEETASQIIDSRIPLGQAKMILMMEQSLNPLAIPLWLYTPTYIHAATSQTTTRQISTVDEGKWSRYSGQTQYKN